VGIPGILQENNTIIFNSVENRIYVTVDLVMHPKHTLQIVLASASPRRKSLLEEAGYQFTIHKSSIDEAEFFNDDIEPWQYTEQLALAKAKDVAPKYPDKIVIGADTVVDFNGKIIGKPTDAKDAKKIIEKLFSNPHKVITGIAMVRINDNTEIVTHDVTTIYPKRMTRAQISEHIKSDSWKEKAGAYAIQENGDKFIKRISGSMTNVIGLPMELLERLLQSLDQKI
jgi:septum formation protein